MGQKEKPLEWWEKAQLDLLELVLPETAELVKRYREHPSEWREIRIALRKASKEGTEK